MNRVLRFLDPNIRLKRAPSLVSNLVHTIKNYQIKGKQVGIKQLYLGLRLLSLRNLLVLCTFPV